MKNFRLLTAAVLFLLLGNAAAQTYTYDFSTGYCNWSCDFADYPVTDSVLCELSFGCANLPAPLNTSKQALMISGINYSDDLFMFIKRKVSGLLPNTTYRLEFNIDLASKYSTSNIGIGGAPGLAVIVKVGAVTYEPNKLILGSFYRMNIDKGQQNEPGGDMDTIGNVGVSDTTTVYTIINRNNRSHPFTITTDPNGEVWVCLGMDSGFEGTTTLYFTHTTLTFLAVNDVEDKKNDPVGYELFPNYPNPFNPATVIKYRISGNYDQGSDKRVTLKIYDVLGNEIATLVDGEQEPGEYKANWNADGVPSGMYLYELKSGNCRIAGKMVKIK